MERISSFTMIQPRRTLADRNRPPGWGAGGLSGREAQERSGRGVANHAREGSATLLSSVRIGLRQQPFEIAPDRAIALTRDLFETGPVAHADHAPPLPDQTRRLERAHHKA